MLPMAAIAYNFVLLGLLAVFESVALAQDRLAEGALIECASSTAYAPIKEEAWFAATTASMAITGDLKFSREAVRFDEGAVLKVKYLGNFTTPSFKPETAPAEISCVAVYEVSPPFLKRISEPNNICGGYGNPPEPITYITATSYRRKFASRDEIHLTFFGIGSKPILGTSLFGQWCGEFDYGRSD